MSLLLDALKRAEQEKQARPGDPDAAPGRTSRSLELAPIAAAPTGGPAPAGAPRVSGPASATTPRPAATSRKPKVLWIAGGVSMLVAAIAAAYVWYSIAALAPRSPPLARPVLRPVTPEPPPSAPAVAATPPAARETPPPRTSARLFAPAPEAVVAAPAAATPEAAPPATAFRPTTAQDRPRVPATLSAGYDALRKGDLEAARRNYAAARAAEPASLDAVLGLATVEARSGQREAAEALYRRALEIDPRNPTALAALAILTETGRTEAAATDLEREAARQPGSAAIHLMLGNLHAAQGRWAQAQGAYFEAHRLEPGNVETLHNLAVSLDRLGQPRAAADFYRRALEGARSQASQIDPAAVERRLAEIMKDAPTSGAPPDNAPTSRGLPPAR